MLKSIQILTFLSFLFFFNGLIAQTKEVRIKEYNLIGSIAIKGYDPVAYINQKKAILGQDSYKVIYNGLIYKFSTEVNKNTFAANPQKFEPQYGGWCAYAMGEKGKKVDFDPKTFKVVNGKLYLFYNAYFNNTMDTWNEDEAKYKTLADKNWNLILQNSK